MQLQPLVQELNLSTAMIKSLLDGITLEEARFKPDDQSWSFLEVVCHLLDEEREDFREHLDFILNRQQGGAWHRIDPQGWVTDRKYNQQDFMGVKEEFLAERTRSLEWLKGLSEADWTTSYVSEFGEMTAGDMLSSWVAHDNLHIRQFVELRRSRLEKMVDPYSMGYAGDW